MFEISWSELLILGIVTLIFVGPKELPVFLRTLGKYAGSLHRQANEFKAHFDNAMREAELDTMREEMAAMQARVNAEVMGVKQALGEAAAAPQEKTAAPPTVEAAPTITTPPTLTQPAPPLPATPSRAPFAHPLPMAMTPAQPPSTDLPMPPMPAPPRMGA